MGVDEYEWSGDGGIPVAELSEEQRARRRGRRPRVWRFVTGGLTLAVLIAGVAVAARVANRGTRGGGASVPATMDDAQARLDVLGALNTTIASGSYAIHSTMTETLPNGTSARAPIVAEGTVNVDPVVVVATSNVAGVGGDHGPHRRHQRVGSRRRQLRDVGGRDRGPGRAALDFATLVVGSLGLRAGAVAMQSMASPNGYLHVAQEGVTAVSSSATRRLDGVAVHVYEVDVDAGEVARAPGPDAGRS